MHVAIHLFAPLALSEGRCGISMGTLSINRPKREGDSKSLLVIHLLNRIIHSLDLFTRLIVWILIGGAGVFFDV